MLTVVHENQQANDSGSAGGSLLDEIVRDGARAMLAAAWGNSVSNSGEIRRASSPPR